MSTNYYLNRDPKKCGECGHPRQETEIHIGKYSGGWAFLWHGISSDRPPNVALWNGDSWKKFLIEELAQGSEIRTEYAQPLTLDEFFATVEEARSNERHREESFQSFERVGDDDISYSDFC